MKALKISELDAVLDACQWLQGTFLQEVIVSQRDVALFFFKEGGGRWLVMDLQPQAPSVWLMEKLPFSMKKQTTPIQLFLRSHFLGKRLMGIERNKTYGRIVELQMQGEEGLDLRMELRLIPHGQNLQLFSGDKKIALKKTSELEPVAFSPDEESSAPYEELFQRWSQSRDRHQVPVKNQEGPSRKKRIQKLEKTLRQIQDSVAKWQSSQWQRAGELLVASQSVERAQQDFPQCIDEALSLSENVERCFSTHKKNQSKLDGAFQRIEKTKTELQTLQALTDEAFRALQKKTHPPPTSSKKTEIKGLKTRKCMISADLEFFVGKSAQDNLGLLRKARAWDTWFHLRDFPSAHGILFRNKKRELSPSEVQKAAQFLVQTFAERSKTLQSGESIAVIWAEVRYVRPIKGDRLGRVTYKNTQTLNVKF